MALENYFFLTRQFLFLSHTRNFAEKVTNLKLLLLAGSNSQPLPRDLFQHSFNHNIVSALNVDFFSLAWDQLVGSLMLGSLERPPPWLDSIVENFYIYELILK